MALSDFLRSVVTLEVAATTQTTAGGDQRTWSTVTSGIPAQVAPYSSERALQFARFGRTVSHRVTLAGAVAVDTSHRFIFTDANSIIHYLEVVGCFQPDFSGAFTVVDAIERAEDSDATASS